MENTVLYKIGGRQLPKNRAIWAYMPERILVVDNHLVRFGGIPEGGISLTVTVGVDPMPITLSWHVTMLTDRFPHVAYEQGRCCHWSGGPVLSVLVEFGEIWLLCRVLSNGGILLWGLHARAQRGQWTWIVSCHRGTLGCIMNRVTSTAALLVLSSEGSPSMTAAATSVGAMLLIPLNYGGQALQGLLAWEGWTSVQTGVIRDTTYPVSSVFTASSGFTTSFGGVGSVVTHWGSLAFSSSPGRHAESWLVGIAYQGGVSSKGVAGTEAWVIWPTLGPGCLLL